MPRLCAGILGLLVSVSLIGCGGGQSEGPTLSQQVQQAMQVQNPEARVVRLVQVSAKQRDAGDVAGANGSLNAAASAAQSIEKPANRARSLCSVVTAMANSGNASDARTLVKAASKAVDEIDEPAEKAEATARLAVAYRAATKDADIARMYLKNGEEEAGKIEAPDQKVEALMHLASAHQQVESSADASRLTTSALDLARGLDDARQRCDALAAAGATLVRMKQTDQATALFAEAEAEAEKIPEANNRAYAYLDLARRRIAAGQKQNASPLIEKSTSLADQVEPSLRSSLLEAIDRERARL